jgi:hypothetical protein
MKQVLFIMTHPDSCWEELVEVLEEHPSIQCFQPAQSYHHPDDLEVLTDHIHKKDNSAAVWTTVILDNKDFTCRALVKCCKFIYWSDHIRYPEIYGCKSPERNAFCYSDGKPSERWNREEHEWKDYSYRLDGMKQWHKRTGGLWNPSLGESKRDVLFAAILG